MTEYEQKKHDLAKFIAKASQDHYNRKISDLDMQKSNEYVMKEANRYNISPNEIQVYAMNNTAMLLKEAEKGNS